MTSQTSADLRKVAAGLATAAILGAWTFAGTRASSDDIDLVRAEIEEVEHESKERHEKLQKKVDEIARTIQAEAVAAASFRAEVRAALEIRDVGK